MSNIAFGQKISDKINSTFNGYFSAAPGKNEVTVIENSKPLREYQVFVDDNHVTDFKLTYGDGAVQNKQAVESYKKLSNMLAKYR